MDSHEFSHLLSMFSHLLSMSSHLLSMFSHLLSIVGLTPPPSILYKDLNWPMNHSAFYHLPDAPNQPNMTFTAMPTLADRLETYRQLAAGRNSLTNATNAPPAPAPAAPNPSMMQPILSGHGGNAAAGLVNDPYAANYNLIERTQDLRNWLKQAKSEHEMLNGSKQTDI